MSSVNKCFKFMSSYEPEQLNQYRDKPTGWTSNVLGFDSRHSRFFSSLRRPGRLWTALNLAHSGYRDSLRGKAAIHESVHSYPNSF
jgi:hypothetical protein